MTALDRTAQAIDGNQWTPSDTLNVTDINNRQRITDGISVSVAGNVRVTYAGVSEQGGADTAILALAAGVIHPLRVSKIWATSTTATGINVHFT